MRDYTNIDKYLSVLQSDIYPQPADENHTAWAKVMIEKFMPISLGGTKVLDVGCGTGFCKPFIEDAGHEWRGITLDKRVSDKDDDIDYGDISFLPYDDNSFSYIFARHILEHSPMPLLTLMEWYRVSSKGLMVVLPSPEYWGRGGANHYYVLREDDWWVLFDRAGWKVARYSGFTTYDALWRDRYPSRQAVLDGSAEPYPLPPKQVEFWYLLEKK